MRSRFLLVILLMCAHALAQRKPERPMATYQTQYYVIHTDLTGDRLKEAALRMTKMAEEYHNRTKGFAGQINQKLPFYLFNREADYLNAGGMAGSAGVFMVVGDESKLMADERAGLHTWNVVQHEGFHQFAHAVIGGELPIWVNEGMAEYFGEGLFTGDGFITGVIPPRRLDRVKQNLRDHKFRPIRDMMLLAHADWNEEMSLTNYDQAWSMVQFLAHAENGKYQGAFATFMCAVGSGQKWDQAWLNNFGSAEGFEQRWQDYWLKLPTDVSLDLYAKAATSTLTSLLARATTQRQKFPTFDDFATAAKAKSTTINDTDWLPQDLIDSALADVTALRKRGVGFALNAAGGGKGPTIVCTLDGGKKLVGHFRLNGGKVAEVVVDSPR
jgi:hypothetical protein